MLRRAPIAWLLGAFYFLTFGGFVAFSIYLPTLLRAQFGLAPADAGFRAAGFVVLATLMRPVGGWLADRIGGAQVLSWVFGGVAVFSLLLAWPSMVPFTVGALGVRGAAGPRQRRGVQAGARALPEGDRHGHRPGRRARRPGRLLPAAAARRVPRHARRALAGVRAAVGDGARCCASRISACSDPADVAWRESLPVAARRRRSNASAPAPGRRSGTAALAAAIVVGSRNLQHFDAALVGYTFATLFATFGITYRYAMWLQRPPTRMYWRRGWQAFFSRGARSAATRVSSAAARSSSSPPTLHLPARPAARPRALADHVGLPPRRRDHVPAGLGLDPLRDRAGRSRTSTARSCSASRCRTSRSNRPLAFVIFHGLVWSSFLVIAGVMLAFRRRMIDHGAVAVQQFGQDILPLLLLFAISVTGLMLTASYTWMKGYAYDFLAILHAVTVIVTLLWLPFGKLFHVFQRPAQLGVSFYKDAGARGEQARCRRCRQPFASAMMVRDLHDRRARARVSRTSCADGGHYQEVCPRCRRALFGLAQGALWQQHLNAVTSQVSTGNLTWRRSRRRLRIIERFGPHLSSMTGARLSTSVEPERLVKTHCCFCGQQCGIQLKVRDNEVIGFEPWEEFPFNRGMLCPKGVKRYLQGSHPDRLLTALRRDPSAAGGFSADAVRRRRSRASPREIDRMQQAHGAGRGRRARRREPDDREDLSARQVRARLPEDAVHRLQRPALHGQRRRGQQEGVRHRSHHQSLVRHGRHRRDLGRRLERRRVLADHDQLHLAGARAGREDHRPGSAHHAGRAHLRSVPAGQARPRRGALRRRAADHDRARLARSRVHRASTPSASTRSPSTAAQWTLRADRRGHRRAAARA